MKKLTSNLRIVDSILIKKSAKGPQGSDSKRLLSKVDNVSEGVERDKFVPITSVHLPICGITSPMCGPNT